MELSEYIQLYFKELWYLTTEMAPYLLLGFLIAGILHVYLPKYKVKKFIGGKNLKASVYASLLGVPLPLCSCGVIPTGVSFYQNGASKGSTVSFLISTPQTGLDSILVTYSLLGLPFAVVRPVIAFITGVFGGVMTNKLVNDDTEKSDGDEPLNADQTLKGLSTSEKLKELYRYAFVEFLNDISKWLIIGLLLAALIAVVVPDDFFGATISNEYAGIFLMLLASVPMYVCATASVPIAAVLMAKGLSPGAALVFLMAGPATNMATIMVIGKAIGKRTLILYLFSIISGSILFALLINEVPLIRDLFTEIPVVKGGHVHMLPHWLGYSSAFLLLLLIINGFIQMRRPKPVVTDPQSDDTVVKVKGMSCSHCELNVEKRLSSFEGVETVSADFKNETVRIKGHKLNVNELNDAINKLGYEVVE